MNKEQLNRLLIKLNYECEPNLILIPTKDLTPEQRKEILTEEQLIKILEIED